MQKITPFLWFNDTAEEAANFYVSIFPNSRVTEVMRAPEGGPNPPGSAMGVSFVLNGLEVQALNGGPHFKLNEAFSMFVSCDNQAEVDSYWNKLTADGGEESMCGWLKDKYGLSWQIIPTALGRLMGDSNPTKAGAVMQAMLQMHKIEVPKLQAAYDAA